MNRALLKDFLVPLALLVALTVLIGATGADLIVEKCFYVAGSGWVYSELGIWKFLYDFGRIPAMAIAALSFVLLVAGFFSARAYLYRKCALFFLLLYLLGPGLLVNTVLKEQWGRPRPRQIQLFGGDMAFHPAWERGEQGTGRSFPSGHAAAGFYLLSPFFVLRKSSREWANAFLSAGIGYGSLMGIARMVQGGHFLSDILWAWGCVYLMGVLLYYLLRLDKGSLLPPKAPKRIEAK